MFPCQIFDVLRDHMFRQLEIGEKIAGGWAELYTP